MNEAAGNDSKTTPRLSANLRWIFTELPFAERFEAAARAGFEAVEYGWPYDHQPSTLREALVDNGLRMVLINTPQGEAARGEASGQACLPGRREAFRDNLKRSLDYATALDCPLVQVQAGVRPPDVSIERAWATYVANLLWACDAARSTGVQLIVEPVNGQAIPGFFLRTQEMAAAAIEAVGADRLGLLFDVYHAQVEQGDVTRRLEAAMPTIRHIQVADVPGRGEPGTGELNWRHVFGRIAALGYAGWIGCEYKPMGTTLDGLAWRTLVEP